MGKGQACCRIAIALLLMFGGPSGAQDAAPVPRPKPDVAVQETVDTEVAAAPITGPPTTGGRTSGATFYEMTGAVPVTWSSTDTENARKECAAELSGLPLTYRPVGPIGGREGCGAAAPIEVSAVAGVKISPPATLTCPFARQLHRWVRGALQQAAKAALNDEVTSLVNVASYTCRLVRGDETKRISQHALSNALDISKFKVKDTGSVSVTGDWGDSSAPDDLSRKATFLRYAHESACEVFSTVLGPDANDLHKDHLHFDLRSKPKRNVTCR